MDLLTPGIGLLVWTLIAFLLVFFILKKFAWKIIIQSLNDREKGIADSLESAHKVKAEMAQMKSENEALMVQAREERTKMLKEAKDLKEKFETILLTSHGVKTIITYFYIMCMP